MKRLLTALCLAWMTSAQAIPEAARALAPDWTVLGQGEMRWFGLRLYSAELWSSRARFDAEQPFALRITYARRFEGKRLSSASIDEMRRIGYQDAAQLARWRQTMNRVFPDVAEGDVLTGVYLPERGAAFYLGPRLLAEVEDAEFARAFFGIWLDPRTREPGLRQQLLGQGK